MGNTRVIVQELEDKRTLAKIQWASSYDKVASTITAEETSKSHQLRF